jgi:hypothetical protein
MTKDGLNKKSSAIRQTTFYNGNNSSDRAVQNKVSGSVFEIPGLEAVEESLFSFS